ncbi:MAG TPA: choice-of-anchor P family protein [Candidatus Thermoplasmatota archaeon]|nr:choice-of-anchor P family protein [Candidatus Thermoplasmatota archaeon]
MIRSRPVTPAAALLLSMVLVGSPAGAAVVAPIPNASAPDFERVGWTAFPPGAPVRDHEAAFGAKDPTHGLAHGVNPAAIDIASGVASVGANPGPEPSLAWSDADASHVFFRLRVGGDPTSPGKDPKMYKAYHWNVLVDADGDGMSEFVVDLFGGKRADPPHPAGSLVVHNNHACEDVPTGNVDADNAVAPGQVVWSAPASKASNAYTRARATGDGQYWIEMAVPWTAFTYARGVCAGERALFTGSSPGLFASTSASNTNPLQKDWMAGAVLAPRLEVSKSADVAEAAPGGLITYTLEVANVGSGWARTPTLTDAVPAHTSFVSASNGGIHDAATGLVRWTLPSLAPGARATVDLSVVVADPLPSDVGAVENVAVAGGAASNAVTTPIVRAPALALALVAAPPALGPGGVGIFTFSYANTGSARAIDVVLETAFEGPGIPRPSDGVDMEGGFARWSVGDLEPGASGIATLRIDVDAALEPGVHTLVASGRLVAANAPATAAGPATILAMATAGLAVTSTPSIAEARPGDAITWTIAWRNDGNATVADARLEQVLPPGFVVVSVGDGGRMEEGVLVWVLGTLGPGASGATMVVVRAPSTAPEGRTLHEDAVTLSARSAAPARAVSQVLLIAEPLAELGFEALAPATGPGGALAFRATWSNGGDAVLRDAVLSVLFEGPVSPASLRFPIGDVAPGANGAITFDVRADERLRHGSHPVLAHAALASANAPAAAAGPARATVVAGAALALAVDVSPERGGPGDAFRWNLAWANVGNGTAASATLADLVPPGFALVAISPGGIASGDALLWTLRDLAAGSSGAAWFEARAPAHVPAGESRFPNDAKLSAEGLDTVEGSVEAIVASRGVLALAVSVSRPAMGPGDVAALTITLTNVGNAAASDARVEGLVEGPARWPDASPDARLAWDVGRLDAGETRTLVVGVVGDAIVPHGIHEVVASFNVRALDADVPAPAGVSIGIHASARLSLASTVEPGETIAGGEARFRLAWANLGNGTARGARLLDVVPAHATLVDAGSGAEVRDGLVTWRLGDLHPGARGFVDMDVRVAWPMPNGTTRVSDDALLEAEGPEAARDAATLLVRAAPDLAVAKTVDRTAASPGDRLFYTIGVENRGSAAASNVLILDALPGHLSLVETSESCGLVAETREVRCLVGTLAAGARAPFWILAAVDATMPSGETRLVNVAEARFLEGAPARSNEVETVVAAAPEVEVLKRVNPGSATEGELLRYVITVVNHGNADARDLVVRDPLPPELEFVDAEPEAVVDGSVVTWQVPLLEAHGGSITLLLLTRVRDLDVKSVVACNAASVEGANVPATESARACVRLSCAMPDPLASSAAASVALVGGAPSHEVAQRGEGRQESGSATELMTLPGVRIGLGANAVTGAVAEDGAAVANAQSVFGPIDVLGRLKADGAVMNLVAATDGANATWSIEGTRFLNLTLDGVPLTDVVPGLEIDLAGARATLLRVDARTEAPRQGYEGFAAFRSTATLTLLALEPVLGAPVSVGVAHATALTGVEPECSGPSHPWMRADAALVDVGGLHAVHAGVRGLGGEDERRGDMFASPLVEARGWRALARGATNTTWARAETGLEAAYVDILDGLVVARGLEGRIVVENGPSKLEGHMAIAELIVEGQAYAGGAMPQSEIPLGGGGRVLLNERIALHDGGLRVNLIRVEGPDGVTLALVGALQAEAHLTT